MRDFFSIPKNGINLKVFHKRSQSSTYHLTVLKSIIANVPDFIHYISCLRVELTRFPYREDCVNEWFKLTEEDDEGRRIIQAINMDRIKRKGTIQYPPQYDIELSLGLLDSDPRIFFHGTNHEAAKSILEDGITLIKGAANQDFSSNKGFYLGATFEEAIDWACHRFSNHRAIVVFQIRIQTLKQYTGLDLRDKPKEWEEIVFHFRSKAKNKKFLKSIYKNYDYIEGPMASVSKKGLIRKDPIEGSYQFCILSEELAKKFDACLHSLIFY